MEEVGEPAARRPPGRWRERVASTFDPPKARHDDAHAATRDLLAAQVDRPIAGLIQDLKRRGMLDALRAKQVA